MGKNTSTAEWNRGQTLTFESGAVLTGGQESSTNVTNDFKCPVLVCDFFSSCFSTYDGLGQNTIILRRQYDISSCPIWKQRQEEMVPLMKLFKNE